MISFLAFSSIKHQNTKFDVTTGKNRYLFIKTMICTHRELWSSKPRSLESGTGSCRELRERWSPGPRPRFPPVDLQESREALQLAKRVPVAAKWALRKGGRKRVKTSCDMNVNTQNVPYFPVGHTRMTVTSFAREWRGTDTCVFILHEATEAERRGAAMVHSEEKQTEQGSPQKREANRLQPSPLWRVLFPNYKYPYPVPRLCPSPAAGA